MMKEKSILSIKTLVCLVLMAMGCLGTTGCFSMVARNFPDTHPRVYPGVYFVAGNLPHEVTENHDFWAVLTGLVDLPLEAIFDTIMLPYDGVAIYRHHVKYNQ